MKKLTAAITLALITITASAQKLEKAEYDKFSGTATVKTTWVNLSMSKPCYSNIRMWKTNGGVMSVEMRCATNNTEYIDETMPIIFLDNDGEKHELHTTKRQWASLGGGARGMTASQGIGFSVLYVGDMSFLSKTITDIRVTTSGVSYDIEVNPKDAAAINKQYKLISNVNF